MKIQRLLRSGRVTERRMGIVIALLSVTATLAGKMLLWPYFESRSPFLLFVIPVAISAWYGGLWPGLFATAFGAIGVELYFLSGPVTAGSRALRIILFIAEGFVISGLTEVLHSTRRRLADTAEANRRLLIDANRANKIKDEVLASVSHDLRTPMTAILVWIHLLQSGKLSTEKVADAVLVIKRNVQIQLRLLNDILDTSQYIATGEIQMNRAPIELLLVLKSAIELLHPICEQKGVELKLHIDECNCHILGNEDRLQQVFWNLLSNAVKFTSSGGWIAVRCQKSEQQIRVEITDNGIGISPEFLPHIFERFRQERRIESGAQSLGLGLAITKHIIDLHGGTISARSAGNGQGSTFTITLQTLQSVT